MKAISLLVLLVSFQLFAQSDLSNLDGKVSPEEKQRFTLKGENGNSQISASIDGNYLKVNVSSDSMYVASICLCTSDKDIIVLHASAALGKVSYQLRENNSWKSDDSFDWKIRETDMKPETIQKRIVHLNEYGWVANTLGMGTRQDAEFVIRKDLFMNSVAYLAAGLMPRTDPKKIIPLPTKTSGDCADFALVAGPPKSIYSFEPKKWIKLKLNN